MFAKNCILGTSHLILLTVSLPSPAVSLVADGMTTSISIHLTWEQPKGSADAVERYAINYTYVVDECRSEGGNFPPVIVTYSNNGSLGSYTLIPVEEDSIYFITLIARNNVTESRSDTTHTFTHNAAMNLMCTDKNRL